METAINSTFLDYFSTIEDPRIERKKLHPIPEILLVTMCGVISGCDGWGDIEAYGKKKIEFLRKYLPFNNAIPSDDTLRRFFRTVNPEQLKSCFLAWLEALRLGDPELISIDGKCICGSHDKKADKKAVDMVSAFASNARLVLGQEKVDNKSNEITAIPKLLKMLDISTATVTIDAMGCQKDIAKQIREQNGDYILGLKGNQGSLHEDIKLYFANQKNQAFKKFKGDSDISIDKDHGRIEERTCYVTSDISWLENKDKWVALRSIIMIKSYRDIADIIEAEERYYISSHEPKALKLNQMIRSHWSIENSLHWILDVSFNEDYCRIRKGNAPENIAIIRHIALNMLQKTKPKRQSIKQLRKIAGWDDGVLESILLGKEI